MAPGFEIIGSSPRIREIRNVIQKVSLLKCPILISGETGTGKHLVAKRVHEIGILRNSPFVEVHCCLDTTIIKAEFLRWFVSAASRPISATKQLSEEEMPGTVLLHEISHLPLDLQAIVESFLRDTETTSTASTKESSRAVPRLIASTSCDLSTAVSEGRFSQDLYYLLNAVPIFLPPLRRRKADIPLLAGEILRRLSMSPEQLVSKNSRWILSAEAIDSLVDYDWPGNIRELRNYLVHVTLFSSGPVIRLSDLPAHRQLIDLNNASLPGQPVTDNWKVLQKNAIREALVAANGDKAKAAQLLGIGKTTVYRKLHEYKKEGWMEPGSINRRAKRTKRGGKS